MTPLPTPPSFTPAVWVVAAHGVTDAWTCPPSLLAAYALALPPWPATTLAFFVASVVHLADDLGRRRSLAMHAGVGVVASRRPDVAFALMLAYLTCFHMPTHYARVWRALRTRPRARVSCRRCVVVVTTLAALRGPPIARVSDAMQRIVCVHTGLHTFGATRFVVTVDGR